MREQQIIEFARVGLRRNVASREIELREDLVFLIARAAAGAREQALVRRRRADGAADALRRERVVRGTQLRLVDQQVLRVNGEPITERRRLRGLQVGIPHARERRVLFHARGETAEQGVEAFAEQRERAPHAVRFDRVFHVHRRGTEMNLAAADRRLRSEDANLGHEVVPDLAFDRMRGRDVDLARVGGDVGEFGGTHEPATRLRTSERDPYRAPETPPFPFGKQFAKLGASVSPRERRGVGRVVHLLIAGSPPTREPP